MAAVSIAGQSLECSDGGEGEVIIIGEESRAYAGNLRNSVRAQKRTFNFVTAPTTEAIWDTLRAAIANRAQVTVTGTLISGDTYTASVRATAKLFAASSPVLYIITGQGEEV
jgi:hypothetical protein